MIRTALLQDVTPPGNIFDAKYQHTGMFMRKK